MDTLKEKTSNKEDIMKGLGKSNHYLRQQEPPKEEQARAQIISGFYLLRDSVGTERAVNWVNNNIGNIVF